MPDIWKSINNSLKGNGLELFIFTYILIFIFLLVLFIYKKIYLYPRRIFLVIFISLIYIVMFKIEENPGEKFHLIQYGIFGLLLYFPLKQSSFGIEKYYTYAIIITFFSGFLDEIIQGILPNRHFTWHDVIVNFLSAFLAVILSEIFLEENEDD